MATQLEVQLAILSLAHLDAEMSGDPVNGNSNSNTRERIAYNRKL